MTPKTFDQRFIVKRPGLFPRLARDIDMMWYLAGMAWKNLTIGAKVRRRYRACQARGEPYWIDDMPGRGGGRK